MKDTLLFGLLTLTGGLAGAFAGHFMPDERLTIACYALGVIAVPFTGMHWIKRQPATRKPPVSDG